MVTLSQSVASVALVVMMVILNWEGAASQRGPYIKKKPTVVQPVVPPVEEPDVQGNSQPSSGNIQVKGTSDEALLRRMDELENTVTTMKQDKVQLEQDLHSLRLVTFNLKNEFRIVTNKVVELERIATNNRELTRLLTYFETFFGVLYREESEAFNPNVPVETRLSRLSTYMGNLDAEFAELRPKPSVEIQPDTNGVSSEVGIAVMQLSEANSRLVAKVETLEQDVATTTEELTNAKSKAVGGFGGTCTCNTDDMEERLGLVERTTAVLLSPILDPELDDTDGATGTTSRKAGTTVDLLSADDIDLLRDFTSRAVSDTRKSVFSAIRHNYMLGDDVKQTLTFDTVHVNKGSNFKNNSVFICTTEGFYFFHFTVRSFDGHYMGVALVKNDELMTAVYTDASERSIMQSQSIVLHMTKGDTVHLEIGSSERFAVHSDQNKYITFNGFLIFKGR